MDPLGASKIDKRSLDSIRVWAKSVAGVKADPVSGTLPLDSPSHSWTSENQIHFDPLSWSLSPFPNLERHRLDGVGNGKGCRYLLCTTNSQVQAAPISLCQLFLMRHMVGNLFVQWGF